MLYKPVYAAVTIVTVVYMFRLAYDGLYVV